MILDGRTKGFPQGLPPTPQAALGGLGLNLLREEVDLPVAVLREDRLRANEAWMGAFLGKTGASLAPHGKTTCSPELFRRQLEAGAWGLTVATLPQLRVALEAGARKVILANQLVAPGAVAALRRVLTEDAALEVLSFVDGPAGVERLAALAERTPGRALDVLVELGYEGGRTGARSGAEGLAVARGVAAHPQLRLRGVACYEGLLAGGADGEAKARGLLQDTVDLARAIEGEKRFAEGEVILSAGGSATFDLVQGIFGAMDLGRLTRVVLRSGCYLSHDHGFYARLGPDIGRRLAGDSNPRLRALGDGDPFQGALEVWAYVQSRPEPGLAILTAGKRDLSSDLDLPRPLKAFRPGVDQAPRPLEGCRIRALNDQHAHLELSADCDLQVGDMVALGVSHPCTTFDKWRLLYLVDADYSIMEAIHTEF